MWCQEYNLTTLKKYVKFYWETKSEILEAKLGEYYYKQLVPRIMENNCILSIGNREVT